MTDLLKQTAASISESIRFDSSLAEPLPGMPFGKGAADCLEHFLSTARSLGFETKNYDNYIGEVLFGKGKPFAVLAHLDVVPAGSGWTKEPFGGAIEDGKIWGRGAIDDKGPAFCALYALKALKDEGFTPNRTIKLIVGCNEENNWACIEHYEKFAELPEEGFSPDGAFPVIYAEKGILQVRLHFPLGVSPFFYFRGGESHNMVCDCCEATPRTLAIVRARTMGFEVRNKKVIAYGKAAHASTPERGENAIEKMLLYFEQKDEGVRRVLNCVFRDIYGLKRLKDGTGSLTLAPTCARYRRGELQVICDIRYPATVPFSAVANKLALFGVKYETLRHQPPLLQDRESRLVRTLLDVYNAYTGESAEPKAIGGGTYARALKHGVAFGPETEDDEPRAHCADEYISLGRAAMLLSVYTEALRRLTR